MTKYLSDDLASALITQFSNECYNGLLYLFIGGVFRNKGLNNLAKFFESQREEELGHSMLIYNFLTDMNQDFEVLEIDAIKFPINTIADVSDKFTEREIATTESLEEILAIAEKDGNGVATEFMRQMVDRQRGEVSETTDFADKAELCGDNWFNVFLWDTSIPSEG